MNLDEFIFNISKKLDIQFSEANTKVTAILDVISNELALGNEIKFVDFGVFRVKKRAPRKGYNPYYQKSVDIPACNEPCFDPGKLLKEQIKSS